MRKKIKLILEFWGFYHSDVVREYRIQKMQGACFITVNKSNGILEEARIGDMLRESQVEDLIEEEQFDITIVEKPR